MGQSDDSDIQLSGLGINQNHAQISVVQDQNGALVNITPLEGARLVIVKQNELIANSLKLFLIILPGDILSRHILSRDILSRYVLSRDILSRHSVS